jgi:acyl carrier protein
VRREELKTMGLDGVELLMAVEERFGIDIPDEDAEKLVTPGHLQMYVLGRLQEQLARYPTGEGGTGSEDLREGAEGLLRHFLAEELGVDEETISVRTSLKRLIPAKIRRGVWENLKKDTALPVPKLRWSGWLFGLVVLGGAVLAVPLSCGYLPLGIMLAIIVMAVVWRLTMPLARSFPRSVRTFGDLVDFVLSHQEGLLIVRAGGDLWPIIQGIVVEQLSVKPEDVTPSARFVEDLGVG